MNPVAQLAFSLSLAILTVSEGLAQILGSSSHSTPVVPQLPGTLQPYSRISDAQASGRARTAAFIQNTFREAQKSEQPSVEAVITVKINEVESEAGTPGDWIELHNGGASPADVSGFAVRDKSDTHSYVLPAGSVIPGGGYFIVEEAALGFGFGAPDSARLYDSSGALIDSYTWTAHASPTYGRCPDSMGSFTTTIASTKGATNSCPAEVTFSVWPGNRAVRTAGPAATFNGNMSGLIYEGSGSAAPGVLWAARNGPGALFRLVFNGTIWTPDAANGWANGKLLRYPDGTGDPDAEGVTFADSGSTSGLYVSTERNNAVSTVSRNAILRFDPAPTGRTLTAAQEWNLTADLPVTDPNLGLEAITWIPDSFLVSRNFFDESKNRLYNPAVYPNHGTGLFLVGLEANGVVYAYALDHSVRGGFTRIATIITGFPSVMELQFDRDLNDLWAICDDTCQGRSVVLRIDSAGKFTVAYRLERPAGMPNLNNEGFGIAPAALCSGGTRPVYWIDDSETDGHAIRTGTLTCTAF